MRFKDKIVMVTGGAAGIGRTTAEAFAREGAKLAICDVNPQAGEEAAQTLGPEASFHKVDVANEAEVAAWADATVQRYGRIDVLVNNAGITRDALLLRMKESDWDLVMSINLKGAFLCTRAVVRHMAQQRSGRVVNVASVVGVVGNVGQANYVASKAGLIGLTKTVARVRRPRHHGQRGGPRLHRDADDRRAERQGQGGLHRTDSARAGGQPRGRGRGRDLPRLRPGGLPDRAGAARQRRHVHVRTGSGFTVQGFRVDETASLRTVITEP
jgi:3-oxoacyl-[acyl-carrier protein] reductase